MTDMRAALNAEHEADDIPWGWEHWRGVTGTWYARRTKSSPPIVLRAESLTDLREQVREYLAAQGRPWNAEATK
jgi:hypothetical protein